MLLGTACAAAVVAGHARAAEAPAAIEEVIVTAQKRSENVQNVPISVVALGGETLAKTGVTNVDALQRFAPGLTVANVGSGFVSYTYLRGAGTNQFDSGSDPSVAYFLDEVYLGGSAGLQVDLFDIDRVEVLKGPQGTLFGRNAAAGAISITTRRPSPNAAGDFSAEIGNFNAQTLRGSVTGPLGNGFAYRLSAGYKHRDAFTENLAPTGSDPGTVKSFGVRGQLEWRGEKATFLLSGDMLKADNGMNAQFISSAAKNGQLSAAAIAALPPGESFYAHFYNVDGFERQDVASLTGRLEWETPLGQLTSITALRSNHYKRLQDQDGTIAAATAWNSREVARTFSEEVRLTGDRGPLNWIAGIYYYDAEIDQTHIFEHGPAFPVVALQNVSRVDISQINTRSYAAFGQATYHFTDRLDLTVGARYTHDKKSDDRSVKTNLPVYFVSASDSWQSFDPAVTLQYQATDTLMAYASYRRGYKSGGFQTLFPANATVAATPFLPERVNSYELGVKSQWFDRRLLANAALFRADIENQQILRVTAPGLTTIDNAGATRTDGADLSFIAKPVSALRLSADMTFQNAKFVRYQNGAVSLAGFHQLRSPDFMGAYSAEYEISLADQASVTLRADYTYRSRAFFDNLNSELPGLYQPGFGLLNARISYAPARASWRVSAWGRNLGDEKYYRNIAVGGVTGVATPGDPLTYGLGLDLNW
ncbi:TonB-dependent receptor [Phenylobacterium conjunctum]|uniref:TonB-dependent receptor n=1 Tax=Phenylobacterium conjunctum TaxID=1298959 RepID=A0ABW3T146_9CAUL